MTDVAVVCVVRCVCDEISVVSRMGTRSHSVLKTLTLKPLYHPNYGVQTFGKQRSDCPGFSP